MRTATTRRRITFVDLKMPAHANRSGYRQVTRGRGKHQPARVISPDPNPGILTRGITSVSARLVRNSGLQWYNRISLRSEFSSLREICSQREVIVHYLYGENSFRYAGVVRRSSLGRNCRLVATYHTPGYRFRELVKNPEHVGSLDAVVIVSEAQRSAFSGIIEANRVHFIPHGIDTSYFVPSTSVEQKQKTSKIKCITVGNHLRDYDTLAKVASQALEADMNIEFSVIANRKNIASLPKTKNIVCMHGLSDDELLKQYQRADLLLLPLQDATANNSLLEGMACGLPVLASDLIGVRDYAPGQNALYAKDWEAMVQKIGDICDGKYDLELMSRASRSRAEELSWDNVRSQLASLYSRL